jgi:hypothetical protein
LSRAIVFAFMIMSLNLALLLTNSIDDLYFTETGHYLFNQQVAPDNTYSVTRDVNGNLVNLSDSNSVQNSSTRALSFGPQPGLVDYFFIQLNTLKDAALFVGNFLFSGFFGISALLLKLGMPDIFYRPVQFIIGGVQLIGIYELVRGNSI